MIVGMGKKPPTLIQWNMCIRMSNEMWSEGEWERVCNKTGWRKNSWTFNGWLGVTTTVSLNSIICIPHRMRRMDALTHPDVHTTHKNTQTHTHTSIHMLLFLMALLHILPLSLLSYSLSYYLFLSVAPYVWLLLTLSLELFYTVLAGNSLMLAHLFNRK